MYLQVPVDKVARFTVDAGSGSDQLAVKVLSPTRKPVPSEVQSTDVDRAGVEYTPREVGELGINFLVQKMYFRRF